MEDTFDKKRRNLMIFSIVITSYNFINLKIEKINILGSHFTIGEPDRVYILLWVFLFYFLIRYLQDLNENQIEKITGSFYAELNQISEAYCKKEIVKACKAKSLDHFQDRSCLTYHSTEEIIVYRMSSNSNVRNYRVQFDLTCEDGSGGFELQEGIVHSINISGWLLFRLKVEAFMKSSAYKTYFLEYIFPLLLYLLAVLSHIFL